MKNRPYDRVKFGQNIRRARLAAGLTQAELARRMRCAEGTVSCIERGTVGISMRTLAALCNALETPPAEIFRGIK